MDYQQLTGEIKKFYDNKDGEGIRSIVTKLAENYKEKAEELRVLFKHENQLLAGIATSAYFHLTCDIQPIEEVEYGGLGAIIKESPFKLEFSGKQFHFAEISGSALKYAKASGEVGWYALLSERAAGSSKTSGKAFYGAEARDTAFYFSELSEKALQNSKNMGWSLALCTIYGEDALKGAEITEHALERAHRIKSEERK